VSGSGGWGFGWGLTPWGGFFLPSAPPPEPPDGFDLFCFFDDPTSMGEILVSPDVSVVDAGGQFSIEGDDLRVSSGGPTSSTDDAFLTISVGVPSSWTLQVVAMFTDLPSDFSDITHSHTYFGGQNATGFAGGLFITQAGIGYSGAVHLAAGLVLDGPLQVIPGTAGLIQENVSYTFRIAVDAATSTTYLFATKTVDVPYIGHQLIAILPAIPTGGFAGDGAQLSVRGTAVSLVSALFDQICMGTGLIMPNLPPRADAGRDQSMRTCTLGLLDGTASFDPEGGNITYSWRMIDAPLDSAFSFEGSDGFTVPQAIPDGTAFKFYSVQLGNEDLIDPLAVGDVLLFAGTPYSIVSSGIDGTGFYVELSDNLLADNLVNIFFKLLRQRVLSNPTSAKPSFFPDVPGIWRFDLVVFDGQYLSLPSVTIVNVLESSVPKGVVPDLGFVWQHLSDFWKLVEDRERIQTLWEGMAQVAAAELMTLWQIDYSKSLRDIQRTFQRRWLHYDLKLPEPLPTLTTTRAIFAGITSTDLVTGQVNGGFFGSILEITSPLHDPIRVTFPLPDPYTPEDIAARIQMVLRAKNPGYSATIVVQPSGFVRIRIYAPFIFAIGEGTNSLTHFTAGTLNGAPAGTSGQRLTSRTYKVDFSIDGLGITEGDLLVIGGEAYKISRLADDPIDDVRFQRIVLQTDLPLLPGTTWSIPGQVASRLLDFYNGMVSAGDTAVFEVTNGTAVILTSTTVAGACQQDPGRLGVFYTAPLLGAMAADPTSVCLAYVIRRSHLPIGALVQDIPGLQENIKETDDSALLRRNIDYFIEEFRGRSSLRFVAGNAGDLGDVWQGEVPPDRLWAEVTYLDNRPTIEANFGIPAELTLDQFSELDSDLDYLSAVRGLWYSFINGPTMFNLRVGTQILLGLPYAEEPGTIEEIRTDFSPTQGRILMRDAANTAVVRSYSFPSSLTLEINPDTGVTYAVGDSVTQFAPLVQGAEVVDYIKDPSWFQGILNQGIFFEVEKFHKFMVRVDSAVFNLSSMMFVRNFILRVKPTYVFPLFIVRAKVGDTEVNVTDEVTYAATLILNDGACFNGLMGETTMFDDFRAGGGGVRNQFDSDFDPTNPPPTFPTSEPVTWGFDKNYLCPEDEITFSYCLTHPGGVVPFDGGFQFDVSNAPSHHFTTTAVTSVAAGPTGLALPGTSTVTVTGTLEQLRLVISGTLGPDPGNYEIVIRKNGVDALVVPVTVTPSGVILQVPITLAVAATNTLQVRIRPATGGARAPVWSYLSVTLMQTPIAFAFDTGLPAGDYCFVRVA